MELKSDECQNFGVCEIKNLTFRHIWGILLSKINIKAKAAMGRSKSMNFKEREIRWLKDFPKLSRLKVAPELLG